MPLRDSYRKLRAENRQVKNKKAIMETDIEHIILLYQFSKEVSSSLKFEDIIFTAAKLVLKVLKLKNIAILLWDYEKNGFKNVFAEGLIVSPAIYESLDKTSKKAMVLETSGGYNFLLPLIIGENLTGWIFSQSRDNIFSELIGEGTILADQISLGIEKARLYQQVEEMSRTDGLTQLYRRRYFMERMEQEVLLARRYRSRFSIAMIDIDNFKQYNDTYGHPVGDELLKTLARIIRNNVYDTDIVGRYGGEEFALIMPLVSIEEAKTKIENIRQAVAKHDFLVGDEKLKLSISLGLAHFPSHSRHTETLIQYADQALYQAKQRGKNS